MDASLLGWGAVTEGIRTGGLWSEQERTLHINLLELMGGAFAVKTFARNRQDVHICLRMDKTAIFYINRMGGTRSSNLSQAACELWQWCLQRGITLSAEHIPGSSNTVADQESRTLQSSAEWMMDRAVCHKIFQILGPCQVDLFATRLNNQLRKYISWRPDPFAWATDAFQTSWVGMVGYAFPPFALIGRCLQKVLQEGCSVVLVAPVWDTQHWYPLLLELLVELPILLPVNKSLLQDPFNRAHPLLLTGQLQLAVWKVSGSSTQRKVFQEELQALSCQDGARGLTQRTNQGGIN